jgi:hypothetical protein
MVEAYRQLNDIKNLKKLNGKAPLFFKKNYIEVPICEVLKLKKNITGVEGTVARTHSPSTRAARQLSEARDGGRRLSFRI